MVAVAEPGVQLRLWHFDLLLGRHHKHIIHMTGDRRRHLLKKQGDTPRTRTQEDKDKKPATIRENKERDSTQGTQATGVAVELSPFYNPRSRHAGLVGRLA